MVGTIKMECRHSILLVRCGSGCFTGFRANTRRRVEDEDNIRPGRVSFTRPGEFLQAGLECDDCILPIPHPKSKFSSFITTRDGLERRAVIVMYTHEFLNRLGKVKRNGKGWTALCPAHKDKNPSLSISEGEGKILVHCHTGCTTKALCAALGIDLADLFTGGNDSRSTVETTYDYRDEKGVLLSQVVRSFPKKFNQRRPDDNGGWTYNLEGVRRVLYRLPELLNATSVVVVEGEKDVETARQLGFVATCNSGGAGKWRPEYSGPLSGKYVGIIADADEPDANTRSKWLNPSGHLRRQLRCSSSLARKI